MNSLYCHKLRYIVDNKKQQKEGYNRKMITMIKMRQLRYSY